MKKAVIAVVVIVVLIFGADKVYQIYSRNNVNSHEAVVLVNNQLAANEVDAFFSLKEGTYNPEEHMILFSLLKKEAYLLDTYINLPVRSKNGYPNSSPFDCNTDYAEVMPYGFYNYEIANSGIIARIITKNAGPVKRLGPGQVISERPLGARFDFGKINVFDISRSGISKHCN